MIQLDVRTRRRKRKVYYGHYETRRPAPHPVIRLNGKYLQEYGFNIGDTIDVEVVQDRIVITKSKDETSSRGP